MEYPFNILIASVLSFVGGIGTYLAVIYARKAIDNKFKLPDILLSSGDTDRNLFNQAVQQKLAVANRKVQYEIAGFNEEQIARLQQFFGNATTVDSFALLDLAHRMSFCLPPSREPDRIMLMKQAASTDVPLTYAEDKYLISILDSRLDLVIEKHPSMFVRHLARRVATLQNKTGEQ